MSNTYNVYHMRTFAEKVYREGFQKETSKQFELCLVALYMRDVLGINKTVMKSELLDFCMREAPDSSKRAWVMMVAKAEKYAQKKDHVLVECPYIDMYEDEVEYIDSLDVSDNAKKIVFTMMVHKKLDKVCYEARNTDSYTIFSYATNKRYSSLKRVAHLSKVKDMAKEVMHELYCHNLVDVIETKGTPLKLNFADKICFEGKIAVRITDYEQIGLYWEWLMGKPNIGLCCTCWQIYNSRSKRRCYCEQHQGYQKLGISVRDVVCANCGKEFQVSIKNTRTIRCESCQAMEKLAYDAHRMMEKRTNQSESFTS